MNLPNIITSMRLIVIPLYIYNYLFVPIYGEKLAFLLFVFSGITDVLDGYIARKYNLETKVGAVLDPLADKMLLASVLSGFVVKGKIGYWIMVPMIIKELIMILGAYVLYVDKKDFIQANIFGKMSTFVFYTASLSIMLNLAWGIHLMVVFLALNLFSLCVYFLEFLTIKKAL